MPESTAFCRDWVVWGSAGHAKVLADLIALRGGRVVVLFDNNPQAVSCLSGLPLFLRQAGFAHGRGQLDDVTGIAAALAIGGARGADRLALLQMLQTAGLALPPLQHPSAAVAATARLGAGSQALAQVVLAADTVVGEACILNNHANVDHECELGHGVHIAPGAVLCGSVQVGDYAMVGAGAVVLPRVRIGAGAVVGAGAMVTRDVPAGAVVVGNPARPLS